MVLLSEDCPSLYDNANKHNGKYIENILLCDCLLVVVFKGQLAFCLCVTKVRAVENKQD